MGLIPGSDSDLVKLVIESHFAPDCTDAAQEALTIMLQLNPTKLSYSYSIKSAGGSSSGGNKTSQPTAQGESGPISTFTGYNPMDLKFETYADATGIVPIDEKIKSLFENGGKPSIRPYLDKLQNVLYGYDPETHGPPYLKLIWGNIFPDTKNGNEESKPAVFIAQLKQCDVDIELFSMSGEPIKAKLTIDLESKIAPGVRPLGNSPDLTHVFDIKHGDNLPALCKKVYNSTEFALQVARVNNLPSIYALKPGMKLLFPPLDKSSR